ncbi:hypothetical protein AC579_1384 [Pseudocercospora musae]|uniref:Uncharacterized protein n=1 Tax=Pseudocercospora musae TaxID=113226 RepID=A0A139H7G8_9PEZI|nr:hypothetical protein AC579_1384 [Pseudocercospora musae]
MCTNVYAEFKCKDKHENNDEDPLRIKYIAMCTTARNANPRVICRQRDNEHVVDEDDSEEDCPECKGDTPPETP